MTGAASSRLGKDTEQRVVNYLKPRGYPDARRSGRGFKGEDILNVPWHIDVKDREESRWPTWQRQALAAAAPGQVVVVVRRTRGVTDVGAWEARWTRARRGVLPDRPWFHGTFAGFLAEHGEVAA